MDDRDENPFVVTSNRVRYHARPWSGEFSYHVRRFLSFFLLKIDTHFFLLSFFFSFTVSLLVSFSSIFFFFPLPRSFSFFPAFLRFPSTFLLFYSFIGFSLFHLVSFASLFLFFQISTLLSFSFILFPASFLSISSRFRFSSFFFVFLRFPAFLSFPLSLFSRIKLRFRLLAPAKSFRKRERMFSRTNRSGTTPWRVERWNSFYTVNFSHYNEVGLFTRIWGDNKNTQSHFTDWNWFWNVAVEETFSRISYFLIQIKQVFPISDSSVNNCFQHSHQWECLQHM